MTLKTPRKCRERKRSEERRLQCQRCRYSLLCEGNDGNKFAVLQYIVGHGREPDTACNMRKRVRKRGIYAGQTWEDLGRRIGEHVDEGPKPCQLCGKPVEKARRWYALPTCYACLPPPESLKVISPEEMKAMTMGQEDF